MPSFVHLPSELILEIAGHLDGSAELLPLANVTESLRNLLHPVVYTSASKEAGILTLVQMAVMLGCPHFLQYVLDQGNNMNDTGPINTIPISMAISSGSFGMVEVLLKAERTSIRIRDRQGGTLVHHILMNYPRFTPSDNLSILSLVLANPRSPRKDLDRLDNLNMTPLSISARVGDVGVLKLLIQCGARYDGWRGIRALHLSAKAGHGGIVQYLLGLGVNVNGTLEAGETALLYAVRACRVGIVSILLSSGARQSISLRTSHSVPAVAIQKQNLPILAALLPLAAEQEPTAVRFEYIRAALGEKSGFFFTMLLRIPGFDLGEVNESTGDTILHSAVTCSKPLWRVAYYRLIGSGSDKFQQHQWLGGTPINWAIRKRNIDALHTMIKRGEYLDFKDKVTGATIVHDAVDTGVVEILKMVLDAGASPQEINPQTGRCPIHQAVERGSFEMTSLLLRKTTGYNAKETKTGNTPLHIAVMNGHEFLVDFLLSRGAHPNAQNILGETPGMLAAERERLAPASRLWPSIRQMLAGG